MASEDRCSALTRWRSVSLTHVEFPEGDLLGQALAYVALLPVAILVGLVTLIAFKRELHSISFFGGLVLNEGANRLLKRVLREPRPCPLVRPTLAAASYGMPSSHAQLIWFFVVYFVLSQYVRRRQTDVPWRQALSVALLGAALSVSYSRVYLMYHTWGQVFCGGVAGSAVSIFWFFLTQEVLAPLFPKISAWPISEYFLVRDTSLIPNVLWFEYTATRSEATKRGPKHQ